MAGFKNLIKNNNKKPLNNNINLTDDIIQDDVFNASSKDSLIYLEPDQIKPDPNQPRKEFNNNELNELLTDIENNGQIQAVVVKEKDPIDGKYMLIVGERRWRAISLSKNKLKVMAIKYNKNNSLDIDEFKTKIIQQSENTKRVNMTASEEAINYFHIVELGKEKGLNINQIAELLGINRTKLTKYIGVAKSHKLIDFIEQENISGDIESLYILSTIIKEDPEFLNKLENINILKNNDIPMRENVKKLKNKILSHEDNQRIKKTKKRIKETKLQNFEIKKKGKIYTLKINNQEFVFDDILMEVIKKSVNFTK